MVASCFAIPALGFVLLLFAPGRAGSLLSDLAFAICAGVAVFAVVRHHCLTTEQRRQVLASHSRASRLRR